MCAWFIMRCRENSTVYPLSVQESRSGGGGGFWVETGERHRGQIDFLRLSFLALPLQCRQPARPPPMRIVPKKVIRTAVDRSKTWLRVVVHLISCKTEWEENSSFLINAVGQGVGVVLFFSYRKTVGTVASLHISCMPFTRAFFFFFSLSLSLSLSLFLFLSLSLSLSFSLSLSLSLSPFHSISHTRTCCC